MVVVVGTGGGARGKEKCGGEIGSCGAGETRGAGPSTGPCSPLTSGAVDALHREIDRSGQGDGVRVERLAGCAKRGDLLHEVLERLEVVQQRGHGVASQRGVREDMFLRAGVPVQRFDGGRQLVDTDRARLDGGGDPLQRRARRLRADVRLLERRLEGGGLGLEAKDDALAGRLPGLRGRGPAEAGLAFAAGAELRGLGGVGGRVRTGGGEACEKLLDDRGRSRTRR